MTKEQYQAYLRSPEWQAKRNAALKRARYACQLCNGDSNLNVHHRTYERVGHELSADLIVLDRNCHAKFHDKLPEFLSEVEEYDPFNDDVLERAALLSAHADGFGRWVELAWYQLCLRLGLSVPDAIERVSHDLNGGGYRRKIK